MIIFRFRKIQDALKEIDYLAVAKSKLNDHIEREEYEKAAECKKLIEQLENGSNGK